MQKRFLTVALISSCVLMSTNAPVYADGLTSAVSSLSSIASGESGGMAIQAALSKIGLTAEQVTQVQPILQQSVASASDLLKKYNFDANAPDAMSAENMSEMKAALGSEMARSEASLSDILPADKLGSVMSLLKSQLPSALL